MSIILARYWQALAGLAVSLVLLAGLLATRAALSESRQQTRLEKQAHEMTVAGYRTAAAERQVSDLANVKRVSTEGAAISQETVNEYQDRIAALRADFAERVRLAQAKAHPGSASGADMPGLSNAASGTDETACEAQFPARDTLIASEQAEQLIALQAWVRKASLIDTNGVQP